MLHQSPKFKLIYFKLPHYFILFCQKLGDPQYALTLGPATV